MYKTNKKDPKYCFEGVKLKSEVLENILFSQELSKKKNIFEKK